jgi:hypothetical protein
MYINNKSNNNKNKSNTNKSYSIVDFPEDNKLYGNFIASSPKSAASKAFPQLLKFIDLDENNEDSFLGKFLVFTIININNKKKYKYIGNRVKLKNPISVSKNNGTVTYKYKDVIGKYKEELDQI